MSPCPVCETSARPTGLAVETIQHYEVMRCPHCGLAFTTPRPTPQELVDFYGDAYFNRVDESSRFGYEDYDGESWAAVNAARTWDLIGRWAAEARRSPGRLLDVGGATGDFGARAAADGWDVVVCEVGDTARAKATAKGLATVATLAEVEGPFDLISMFHVLEHLIDPLADLRHLRGLVATEGYLVIEVPQWRSAGRIVRRSKWAQLKPPEHINFFTRRSLRFILERSGWRLDRATTPYPEARRLAMDALRRRDARDFAKQSVQQAAGTAGLGGYMRAVARPA